jgi:hypothetical protein
MRRGEVAGVFSVFGTTGAVNRLSSKLGFMAVRAASDPS